MAKASRFRIKGLGYRLTHRALLQHATQQEPNGVEEAREDGGEDDLVLVHPPRDIEVQV